MTPEALFELLPAVHRIRDARIANLRQALGWHST